MKVNEAVEYCLAYHRSNSQINTLRSYEFLLSKFEDFFGERDLEEISSVGVLSFLTQLCEGNKQGTNRSRYGLLSAFFNLIKNSTDKDREVVFIPTKVAQRLEKYIHVNGLEGDDLVFPIKYPTARKIVRKAGKRAGINLKPHDLRRHAATSSFWQDLNFTISSEDHAILGFDFFALQSGNRAFSVLHLANRTHLADAVIARPLASLSLWVAIITETGPSFTGNLSPTGSTTAALHVNPPIIQSDSSIHM